MRPGEKAEIIRRLQSAAANGHHDGFRVGDLFENFKSQCALPRDHVGILKWMDVRKLGLFGPPNRFGARFVKSVAVQDHRGSELAATRHFHQRCEAGHYDGDIYSKEPSMPGKPERMVSGRRGDHATCRSAPPSDCCRLRT